MFIQKFITCNFLIKEYQTLVNKLKLFYKHSTEFYGRYMSLNLDMLGYFVLINFVNFKILNCLYFQKKLLNKINFGWSLIINENKVFSNKLKQNKYSFLSNILYKLVLFRYQSNHT